MAEQRKETRNEQLVRLELKCMGLKRRALFVINHTDNPPITFTVTVEDNNGKLKAYERDSLDEIESVINQITNSQTENSMKDTGR